MPSRFCARQLEAVVSRLKLLSRMPALAGSALGALRFVAVSATIPNVADVGAWIGAPPGYAPAFGDEYRACALEVKGAWPGVAGVACGRACISGRTCVAIARRRADAKQRLPGCVVCVCVRSARVQRRKERLPV
jgi:hypothetical protein